MGKKNSIEAKDHVYAYCVELECALTELLGANGKWQGMASSFRNHRRVCTAVCDATRVIRKRLANILTADDRLWLTTDIQLAAIEKTAKGLRANGEGILTLLAQFVHLVALLLGYDWFLGKPNREVVYFQTRNQQIIDDEGRHPNSNFYMGKLEHECRVEFAKDLYAKGMRVAQIARILNQSEAFVKNVLVRQGVVTRGVNVKET